MDDNEINIKNILPEDYNRENNYYEEIRLKMNQLNISNNIFLIIIVFSFVRISKNNFEIGLQ